MNDLTRLEASSSRRRKARFDLDDDLDLGEVDTGPSLLAVALEKGLGKELDLIVMDGEVKSIGSKFVEDGGMIEQEVTIQSVTLDDEETSEMSASDLEEDDAVMEVTEENTVVKEEVVKEKPKDKEKASKITFGEYLDMMEVF